MNFPIAQLDQFHFILLFSLYWSSLLLLKLGEETPWFPSEAIFLLFSVKVTILWIFQEVMVSQNFF